MKDVIAQLRSKSDAQKAVKYMQAKAVSISETAFCTTTSSQQRTYVLFNKLSEVVLEAEDV